MKKKLVAIAVIVALSGCAQLDAQNAGKGQKTVEAAGVGGVLGGLAGKLLGVDPRFTAFVGATIAGLTEYRHATDLEIASANKQATAMKAAGITSDVKIVKVKGKDGKFNDELKSFTVHSVSETAVIDVSQVAQNSAFGGKIIVVANRSQRRKIEDQIALIVVKKNIKTEYFTPYEARRFGARAGVAWVPVHTEIATSGVSKEGEQS